MAIKKSGRLGITFQKSDKVTACILKSGIMIAQTPPRLEENIKDEVIQIYRSIITEDLGFSGDILPEG
jgi:hypothetical protein